MPLTAQQEKDAEYAKKTLKRLTGILNSKGVNNTERESIGAGVLHQMIQDARDGMRADAEPLLVMLETMADAFERQAAETPEAPGEAHISESAKALRATVAGYLARWPRPEPVKDPPAN